MEPMTLGSPGSPSNNSGFLPAFLIGEQLSPAATPRNATISPTKGRSLAFGQHSPGGSPKDMNRTNPRGLFNYASTTNTSSPSSIFHAQSNPNLNSSVSGPPTQGLFDSLRMERSSVQTVSTPRMEDSTSHIIQRTITSPYDSMYANMSPRPVLPGPQHNFPGSPYPISMAFNTPNKASKSCSDYWVTVFGFPQSATSMILAHFSQCGTIVDKIQNAGNWVHLRFTSRPECDKALNYNEKVLNNCLMVGVTRCKDPIVLEREREDLENSSFIGNSSTLVNTSSGSVIRPAGVRSLSHAAYKTVQSPIDVTPNPSTPTRSSGMVDKAMDFFFGW